MPIYSYKCPICGEEKEVFRPKPISKDKDIEHIEFCPNCGEEIMERIIQPVNFKIGGYYTSKTGYSKNPEYMKAVERKKKAERKKNG